ncbi:hypothetical protein WMY93_032603 [Mugilogobius chulae]|uniref:SNTX thioredoxin-like domain-containing protein n=1 Tax=Mugilogobius chulae TaxID=88201 RepID=A0AAW0MQZ7_9GOBI
MEKQEGNSAKTSVAVESLGRPFVLGMLYNAPRDLPVPAQKSSNFEVSSSDSTTDNSSKMNIGGSLSLSFLAGQVTVSGSANYLKDKKEFKNQSRVTLQYSATTHFEQLHLVPDKFKKINLGKIKESGLATHVVTGIEYGADAFFVFDSEKTNSSDVQKVKGTMQATIKKIPTCSIEGEAKVDLNEEEKKLTSTFSVKFYGDFLLEKNPATFEEAVKTYSKLPMLLLGKDDRGAVSAVPKRVWLLPLDVFDPQIQNKQLAEKCPAIREGSVEESELINVFEQRNLSPFSQKKLEQWMDNKEREINVVESILDILKDVPVLSSQFEVDKVVLAPGDDKRLGFVFTSLEATDPQLEDMEQFIHSLKTQTEHEPQPENTETPWFYDEKVIIHMREKAKIGIKVDPPNPETEIKFITAFKSDMKGAAAFHYQGGILRAQIP